MNADAASPEPDLHEPSLSCEEEVSREGEERLLEGIYLELPYIPDFQLKDLRYWFVPSLAEPKAAYHEVVGESSKNWGAYYTKKGWNFLYSDAQGERDGPFRVPEEESHLDVLEPGRIFAPRPQLRLEPSGPAIPLVSLEKHKPLNPWKPNYIQALNFIKKYEWPHPLPRRAVAAVWEIEECGQVAGSTSWINAEKVLLQSDSPELRATLADLFYHRPEDYELGSQIYLRVLGKLGDEGFRLLAEQASHPITRKRRNVARVLGDLRDPRGIETLLALLEDEDFGVRDTALRALVKVGVDSRSDPSGKVAAFLESPEARHRVWAAAALLKGGDEEQRKVLVQLVKEENRPLSDLGDLGQVIGDLDLLDAVPFLIKRFKSGSEEIVMDAAEALASITGGLFEYTYAVADDPDQKREIVKMLERWWEEKKRERSAGRQGRV